MNDLWSKTKRHLTEGNFTELQRELGGPDGFDREITAWHAAGRFDEVPDLLAEALSCACMLGRTSLAAYLLDSGVRAFEGMRTGLAGPHYAASGARLDTMKMLLGRNIELEVENMYGGTVLGQALWSAVNESKEAHGEIIISLLDAGAVVEPGTLDWWEQQRVSDEPTYTRVANALRQRSVI